MAEHTRSSIVIEAAPAAVMGVIADFDRYPEWTGEVKEAQVLSRDAEGRAEQVRLLLDAGAIKDDHTLAYTWVSAHEVRWSLVRSQMLRTLDGSYALAPRDGGRHTEVTYQLTVDVKIPMLGMIKRKAEKVIIDRALAGLKKRVEAGAGPQAGQSADGAKGTADAETAG
ncbi:MAG: SRPBCC family protein [Streptomyces sp.]|nr:SRPBCC family protein [Streptomyces sp.]